MLTKLQIIMSVIFALSGYCLALWLCWRYAGVHLAFVQTCASLGIVIAVAFCVFLLFIAGGKGGQ